MNQFTDPLLIELARAAYTCPASRIALHDYWEDRGVLEPLAIDNKLPSALIRYLHRIIVSMETAGTIGVPVSLPKALDYTNGWQQMSDFIMTSFQIPSSAFHRSID